MPVNVFLSYRRQDTPDFTGRLAEKLRHAPGIGTVFMDVESVQPSADFTSAIERALGQSRACVAIIGRDWLGRSANGAARIWDADDWVRLEIAGALGRKANMRIVPVFTADAAMPRAQDLPADIRALTRINGVPFHHDSFDRDADFLADVLLGRKKPARRRILQAAAGLVAAAVVLLAAAVLQHTVTGRALDELVGGPGPTMLLILAVLAVGTLAPFLIARR